jgi:hypothetical protein
MKLSSPDRQSDWLAREGLLRVAQGNSGEARGKRARRICQSAVCRLLVQVDQ